MSGATGSVQVLECESGEKYALKRFGDANDARNEIQTVNDLAIKLKDAALQYTTILPQEQGSDGEEPILRMTTITPLSIVSSRGAPSDLSLWKSPQPTMHTLQAICTGFAFLLPEMWKSGYCHEDIKPENCLVNQTEFRLTDWGSARSIKEKSPYGGTSRFGSPCGMKAWSVGEYGESMRHLFGEGNLAFEGYPTLDFLEKSAKDQTYDRELYCKYVDVAGATWCIMSVLFTVAKGDNDRIDREHLTRLASNLSPFMVNFLLLPKLDEASAEQLIPRVLRFRMEGGGSTSVVLGLLLTLLASVIGGLK
jgi:hypothetical protein